MLDIRSFIFLLHNFPQEPNSIIVVDAVLDIPPVSVHGTTVESVDQWNLNLQFYEDVLAALAQQLAWKSRDLCVLV